VKIIYKLYLKNRSFFRFAQQLCID
jgi:hypothetical protein